MIIGIGNDLVDARRIAKVLERHGDRFLNRCFTEHEQKKAQSRLKTGTNINVLAKRFAAKEACAKALGTGFGTVAMKDIGVVEDEAGKPTLVLKNEALQALQTRIPAGMSPRLHLSLSDEPPLAQAFVIIEAV